MKNKSISRSHLKRSYFRLKVDSVGIVKINAGTFIIDHSGIIGFYFCFQLVKDFSPCKYLRLFLERLQLSSKSKNS